MGKKTAGRCSASFQSLRSQAVAKGQLFTDPSFPADDSSLFLDPPAEASGVVWKRPGEITSDPRLFVEGALGSDCVARQADQRLVCHGLHCTGQRKVALGEGRTFCPIHVAPTILAYDYTRRYALKSAHQVAFARPG
ncbi:hypothetical protein HPB47_010178 [Ixodes persulcatus]|uniref:Uncharacterized protein n=1 Tax=Ixodes persulcatus TaxID=34615 RepID=A0AC60P0I8_IXOPE|nr:hypothetical protein HPB47_010178 [Ixodes persulcatus]